MNIKKYLKLISILPVILITASCVGEEPNDIGYVTALGIDKSNDGYNYTIQFANPTKISGGASEEGGSGENIVENIVVESPNIYMAVSNADSIISKDLSLSHAKILVVSEEVAREGVRSIADTIARNNDIRPDIYIAVAENAKEYLEGVKPVIELNPVKYYQLIYENKKGEAIPQNNAREFYVSCVSQGKDCVLPLAGVAETDTEDKGGSTDAGTSKSSGDDQQPKENKKNKDAQISNTDFQSGTKNYYAGEAGVEIRNKSETMGLAVFKNDKYIGKLGSHDAEIYNILTGHINGSKTTFYSGDTRPVTVKLEEKEKPDITIDKDNKSVRVNIKLESELLSAPEEDYEPDSQIPDKASGEMIDNVAENFLNKLYNKMGVDVLGIRGRLRRFFLTTKSYDEYIKDFNPNEWTFTVNTDFIMKRTGMTYYY